MATLIHAYISVYLPWNLWWKSLKSTCKEFISSYVTGGKPATLLKINSLTGISKILTRGPPGKFKERLFCMTYKNEAILLRIHIIDCLCKLLVNIYLVKPNFNNVTPIQLLKLTVNRYFQNSLPGNKYLQPFLENYQEALYLLQIDNKTTR